MMYLHEIFKTFISNEEEAVYKKYDSFVEHNNNDFHVEMGGDEDEDGESNQEQKIQEFIEEIYTYVAQSLGRPIENQMDLLFGLAKVGDGIEEPLYWWAPLSHPIGAMLFKNQIQHMSFVKTKQFGKLMIYTDSDVRLCADEITRMIFEYRGLQLKGSESGEEKHCQKGSESVEEKHYLTNNPTTIYEKE